MSNAIYLTLLTLFWLAVWIIGAWYFETRRTHGPLLRRRQGKGRMLLLYGLIALPCLYVLSYAPFLLLTHTASGLQPTTSVFDDLYVPVQWLIDQTPFQKPFLWWAAFCQVSPDSILAASRSRLQSHFWGDAPPWQFALGWLTIGLMCCLLPSYVLYRVRRWWIAGSELSETDDLQQNSNISQNSLST